jgi:hypothetical protein
MEGAMLNAVDSLPRYPVVEMILNGIADWIVRHRAATELREELSRCKSEDVAAIARELGVAPGEFRELAGKGTHAADELRQMIVALSLDPQILLHGDKRIARDLQRVCIACPDKKRCKRELAAGTAAANFRSFCPNAFTFNTLFNQMRTVPAHS